jgi:polar amino acid transport system substrate-binding protein
MRKGDKAFVDAVNATLLEMEKSGEAKRIFDNWFGPRGKSGMVLERTFTIKAGN